MFIGAICHDLDHRGFNNKFMIDIGSPLAAIYSTSTMEHHHFNMAVIILQQVIIRPSSVAIIPGQTKFSRVGSKRNFFEEGGQIQIIFGGVPGGVVKFSKYYP